MLMSDTKLLSALPRSIHPLETKLEKIQIYGKMGSGSLIFDAVNPDGCWLHIDGIMYNELIPLRYESTDGELTWFVSERVSRWLCLNVSEEVLTEQIEMIDKMQRKA